MTSGLLGTSLLGNMLSRKGAITNRAGEQTMIIDEVTTSRAGQDFFYYLIL